MSYPTGRSAYDPRRVRVGQAQPQSEPELFSVEDLKAEICHLEALDRRFGRHHLRASAKLKLLQEIARRRAECPCCDGQYTGIEH